MMMTEIEWLDAMLDTARMFRCNERAQADIASPGIVERVDADGERLDAFTMGVFDELTPSYGSEFSLSHLLAYLLKAIDNGPGEVALEETSRLLSLKCCKALSAYVRVGRNAVRQLVAGEPYVPGVYLQLLLGELTSN